MVKRIFLSKEEEILFLPHGTRINIEIRLIRTFMGRGIRM